MQIRIHNISNFHPFYLNFQKYFIITHTCVRIHIDIGTSTQINLVNRLATWILTVLKS